MARFLKKLREKTAEAGEGEFEVSLTGMAHMSGSIKVMAKDAKEAMERAKEQHADVDWSYEGMDEKSLKAEVGSPKPDSGESSMMEPPMEEPSMEEAPMEPAPDMPGAEEAGPVPEAGAMPDVGV